MGIGDIDKLAALLPTYPYALRAVMFGTLLTWMAAYAWLVFNAPPPPPVRVTMVRFAALPGTAGDIAFEFGLENNTGKVALISDALLEFYDKELPDGGLASKQDVTAVYKVEMQPQGGLAVDDDTGFAQQVTLTQPYAGQSYQKMQLPLAQSIADKDTDRFRIVLQDTSVLDARNSHAKVTLTYGSGSTAGVTELPVRP